MKDEYQHEDSILQSLLQTTHTLSSQLIQASIERQRQLARSGKACPLGQVLVEQGYISKTCLTKLLNLEGLIPGYTIREKIGKGKFGIVYKAYQHSMDREVAIKVLNPIFSKDTPHIGRFLREIHALGKLDHPNIIRGLDSGNIEGIHYLIMEYFDGVQLDQYVKGNGGSLPEEEVLNIAKNLVEALNHIWTKELLHRDISPENIMIARSQLKICDFGLVRALTREKHRSTYRLPIRCYDYVSPEQANGERLTLQSDCFSLGGVMYYCLTGQTPFESSNNDVYDFYQRQAVPPKERIPEISSETNELILRLLKKDPAIRCPDGSLLYQEICDMQSKTAVQKTSVSSMSKTEIAIFLCTILALICLAMYHTALAISPSNNQKISASEVYELRAPSVVMIEAGGLLGSGVIFNYQHTNYVVTNYHVVKKKNLLIKLKDGRKYQAKILAFDEEVDLALLSIPPQLQDIEGIPFGDPNSPHHWSKSTRDWASVAVSVVSYSRDNQWNTRRNDPNRCIHQSR